MRYKSTLIKLDTRCRSVEQDTRLTSDFLQIFPEMTWKEGRIFFLLITFLFQALVRCSQHFVHLPVNCHSVLYILQCLQLSPTALIVSALTAVCNGLMSFLSRKTFCCFSSEGSISGTDYRGRGPKGNRTQREEDPKGTGPKEDLKLCSYCL